MESSDEEDILLEEKVNFLRNIFPDFSKSVIKEVLNRSDINQDITLASQVFGDLTDANNFYNEEIAMGLYSSELDEVDEVNLSKSQQKQIEENDLVEDVYYPYQDDSDNETFVHTDKAVEGPLLETPTKIPGKIPVMKPFGMEVMSELNQAVKKRNVKLSESQEGNKVYSASAIKPPKENKTRETLNTKPKIEISELDQALKRRSVHLSESRDYCTSELLKQPEENKSRGGFHTKSNLSNTAEEEPSEVPFASKFKKFEAMKNEEQVSSANPKIDTSKISFQRKNLEERSSVPPPLVNQRPKKLIKMTSWSSSDDSDEEIESSLFSKYSSNSSKQTETSLHYPEISRPNVTTGDKNNEKQDSKTDASSTLRSAPSSSRNVQYSDGTGVSQLQKKSLLTKAEYWSSEEDEITNEEVNRPQVFPTTSQSFNESAKNNPQQVPRKTASEAKSVATVDRTLDNESITMETNAKSCPPSKKPPQPKPKARRWNKKAPKHTGTNEQKVERKSAESEIKNFGDAVGSESSGPYDPKRILVSGLDEATTFDALSNYMELMCGEDVTGVTFLEKGRAVVDGKEPLDFMKVKNKVSKRLLDGKQLNVEMMRVCNSIRVSGISPGASKPVNSILSPVIKQSLPRLVKTLPKGKALCKITGDQAGNFVVVCLENDKNTVSEAVKKVTEVIEKEEIRNAYKKETVKIKDYEDGLLLERMQFVEKMRNKHSELEVNLCKEKQELNIEGPREQFTDFKIRYFQLMSSIAKRNFTLPSAKLGEIICKETGRKYIQNKFDHHKINAIILPQENNAIEVVAENSTACQKAQDCLLKSLIQDKITFQAQDSFIFQNENFKMLSQDLQKSQLVDICTDTQGNKIILLGIIDTVIDAKKKLEELVKTECVRDQDYPISHGPFRLLNEHYLELLKDVESKLKTSHVLIKVDSTNEMITMTGTRDGLRKSKDDIDALVNTFVEETKSYSSPGLNNLLLGPKGERYLKMIKMEKKVVIETSKKVVDGVRDTRQAEIDVILREEEEENEAKEEEIAVQGSHISTGSVYDSCNFTTPTGIKVSWKFGQIQHEVADALVNLATSDLNHGTACVKALSSVGGPAFDAECKPHTNITPGNVVTTRGGNLQCKYVIHASCCHWENKNEQIFRNLMQNILAECVRLGVTSVAIPAIGTGQHGFPEKLVAKIYLEELQGFATASSLKKVRIIIYMSGKSHRTQKISASSARPTNPQPAFPNQRIVTFNRVQVSLYEGDITQQATTVDAIINPLDKSLKLGNGGGVNKVILNAGGQIIQQELDNAPNRTSKVIITSAGSINKANNILHFLPVSTDVKGLQSSIEECFKTAQSQRFFSVSVPAIGTAAFSISTQDSADLILNAAKNFSVNNYQLNVNIVVFQKKMIPDFEAVFAKHGGVAGQVPQVVSQPISRASGSVSPPQPRKVIRATKKSSRKTPMRHGTKMLTTGSPKEGVVLHIYARSKHDIELCIKEVDKFIQEHITTKEINKEKVFNVLVKHWPEVERLARDHEVTIWCNSSLSVVEIRGLVASVSDCKYKLTALLTVYLDDERKSVQKEFISKNVQWYYFQGTQSVAYAKELNILIEMAHMENKEKFQFIKNGITIELDLKGKTERNSQTGQICTISRKQIGESNTGEDNISIPSHWSHQPPSQVVQLVNLQSSSQEYQQVLNHFHARGGAATRINKIERVQNPGLYKAYLVKKQSMNEADGEMQLLHGTSAANITAINANNFNRSYNAGINGTMYGNGVYFARDDERKSVQKEFISKNVQWYYFQGTQSFAYAKELNILIEMAHMENKEKFQFTKNGITIELDLKRKTERNSQTGQICTISRKQIGESNTVSKVLLEPHHIEYLANAVKNDWDRLARLLDVPQEILNTIERDSQDNFSRARKLFEQINILNAEERPGYYTRENLKSCFDEIGVKLPNYFPIPNLESENVNHDNVEGTTGDQNFEISNCGNSNEEEGVSDSTPLSPREIERLSRKMGRIWDNLARMLNLDTGDIDDIDMSLQCVRPTRKAVRVLELYKKHPSFSRDDLAKSLNELKCVDLSLKVRSGILRKR